MTSGTVTQLFTYPIKSCAPIALESTICKTAGFPFDRNFVIASPSADRIFTQRDLPELALIQPYFIDENTLGLLADGESTATVPNTENGDLLKISVWGNDYIGVDQGDEISHWLSRVIGTPCRLLKRTSDGCSTEPLHQDTTRYDAAFVDCCPLSIVFEDELDVLNAKLGKPVPVSRFRPSIVIRQISEIPSACLDNISINELTLDYIRPIGRCVIINIDQENGVLENSEPLKVLASYNIVNNKAALGHYFVAQKSGRISVGDNVSSAIMTSA